MNKNDNSNDDDDDRGDGSGDENQNDDDNNDYNIWLLAPPISSVRLKLLDMAIRVSVAQRLGCSWPTRSSMSKNAPRHQCHSQMTDIIWNAK